MTWNEILSALSMAAGSFFLFVASLGLFRLPDVYCRAHALGKATSLGIIFVLLGFGLRVPETSWLKLLAIVVFQLVSVPVASHLFFLMAYRKGIGRSSPAAKATAASGAWAAKTSAGKGVAES